MGLVCVGILEVFSVSTPDWLSGKGIHIVPRDDTKTTSATFHHFVKILVLNSAGFNDVSLREHNLDGLEVSQLRRLLRYFQAGQNKQDSAVELVTSRT